MKEEEEEEELEKFILLFEKKNLNTYPKHSGTNA